MIISNRKKFIFVHIYKIAGTSVTSALIKYARFRERLAGEFFISRKFVSSINRLFHLHDRGNQWINGLHKHANAQEIRDYCGLSIFESYYKFAFVRNPWDWQVSLYTYIRSNDAHREHRITNQLNFEDFIRLSLRANPPCQLDFLTDEHGKVIVDKIGKFESIGSDFSAILRDIGIDKQLALPLETRLKDRETIGATTLMRLMT